MDDAKDVRVDTGHEKGALGMKGLTSYEIFKTVRIRRGAIGVRGLMLCIRE